MAAMPIYGKNSLKIFFSRTAEGIWTKFGLKHVGTMIIIFYVFRKVWITNAPAIAKIVKENGENFCFNNFSRNRFGK